MSCLIPRSGPFPDIADHVAETEAMGRGAKPDGELRANTWQPSHARYGPGLIGMELLRPHSESSPWQLDQIRQRRHKADAS
jgi:hypothetical protein